MSSSEKDIMWEHQCLALVRWLSSSLQTNNCWMCFICVHSDIQTWLCCVSDRWLTQNKGEQIIKSINIFCLPYTKKIQTTEMIKKAFNFLEDILTVISIKRDFKIIFKKNLEGNYWKKRKYCKHFRLFLLQSADSVFYMNFT